MPYSVIKAYPMSFDINSPVKALSPNLKTGKKLRN
jgi:hypothetical protein